MSFGDFNQRVEDKCIRTWDINWNGGTTLFIQRFEGNSLQAVLSNERRHGKHTRVGVVDGMISIFDSVPRMAGSCEEQAMGAQPSNLNTGGSIRVPEEEEISRTSLGSFTQITPSTCDLIVENWEDLTDVMPLKIAYPALDQHELRTITRFGPKYTEWTDQNGSSWPMPPMEKMRFRWGTTNVVIMTNERIILGREDEEKLKVISAKSNIVFTAMGDATQWQQLFDYVKTMVEIRECMTKDVVTTSKAFEIAKKYLYESITNHPKNEFSFGGILAGWDKKTV